MKVEIRVAEVTQVFKEVQSHPEKNLDMINVDIPRAVGEYLSKMKLPVQKIGKGYPSVLFYV